MTVTPDVEVEIRRLFFAEHWKRGTIATQLGLHDDVVKRVVGPTGQAAHAQNEARVLESSSSLRKIDPSTLTRTDPGRLKG